MKTVIRALTKIAKHCNPDQALEEEEKRYPYYVGTNNIHTYIHTLHQMYENMLDNYVHNCS